MARYPENIMALSWSDHVRSCQSLNFLMATHNPFVLMAKSYILMGFWWGNPYFNGKIPILIIIYRSKLMATCPFKTSLFWVKTTIFLTLTTSTTINHQVLVAPVPWADFSPRAPRSVGWVPWPNRGGGSSQRCPGSKCRPGSHWRDLELVGGLNLFLNVNNEVLWNHQLLPSPQYSTSHWHGLVENYTFIFEPSRGYLILGRLY